MQNKLTADLKNGKKSVSASYNYYYSKHYHPDRSGALLGSYYSKNPYPVILVTKELDHTLSGYYLRKHDVPSYMLRWVKQNRSAESKGKKPQMAIIQQCGKANDSKRPKINYPFNKNDYPPEFMRSEVMLEFLETYEPSDHYYVLTSYERKFKKNYNKFLKKKFNLKKLTEGMNSYNVYLLSVKTKPDL